jgi:glyoxylase-like metal-dependent hydrolase (beta-lactamase superfamily II)
MSIRFLNCASMSPTLIRWHVGGMCLLVDTQQGPVLVDTGLGLHDHQSPSRQMRFMQRLGFGMHTAPDETAVRQVQRLGYSPEDVRHIVLTHIHFDHAGGLPDFPTASIHLHRLEQETLLHPRTWIERYAHDPLDFSHNPNWVLYDQPGEKWFDFDAIPLPFSPAMYLIPLFGHTSGHCGVAIQQEDGWVFQCADALPIGADFDITPNWLNRLIIGSHVPRLKAFSASHPEVRMFAGHAMLTFFEQLTADKTLSSTIKEST